MRCNLFLTSIDKTRVEMSIPTKKTHLYVGVSVLWMFSIIKNFEGHPSFTKRNQIRVQNQPIIQSNKNQYNEYDKPHYNLDYDYSGVEEEPSSGKLFKCGNVYTYVKKRYVDIPLEISIKIILFVP